ncbi:MAG: hypothetical protein ETSY2_23655 [Candidatus Entotheonella gemina]|uniref:Uncharacterized protein n=1 Tax=Candidatus Entotheonella gemina TaxID=1429439 RepID=W4M556_9BACT|nr:MAG: hypothetical protein ETSY2_23655 [Candidatus Entotheonella gemina]
MDVIFKWCVVFSKLFVADPDGICNNAITAILLTPCVSRDRGPE